MQIIILGSSSGIPTRERNHPAIWLRYDGDTWLFDCGEGTQRQLIIAKLNFMSIDRIFITHWHADHWAGLLGLLETFNLEKRARKLEIYAPAADEFVSILLKLSHFKFTFKVKAVDVGIDKDHILVSTRDYQIVSTPVRHSIPSVGYAFIERDRWNVDIKRAALYGLRQGPLIGKLKRKGKIKFRGRIVKLQDVATLRRGKKIVYSGDTKPCKNIQRLAERADLLIHDGTFAKMKKKRAHAEAAAAAKLARMAGVKKLVLTHFSKRYKKLDELLNAAKQEFKNTELAYDFMEIQV
jgi:ribonuclease Z